MDEPTRRPGEPPAEETAAGPPVEDASMANEDSEEPPAAEHLGEAAAFVEEPPAEPPHATPAAPDYKDRWLRAEAELQNFRRRASREWEEGRRMAEESVLLEMVATLDDLERAIVSAGESGAPEAWTQGVTLVAQRMRDYLARQGVTVEDPLGRPFDPTFHEALLELDGPAGAPPGTVVQVAHKGYRRGERALRAARVVVARDPAGSGS